MSGADGVAVCLLLGSEDLPEKFTREVRTLLSETDASVPLVLIDETTNEAERPEERYAGFRLSHVPAFLRMLYRKGPKTLIWAEAHVASLLSRSPTPYERLREIETTRTHIDDIAGLEHAERVYFTPEPAGDHTWTVPDAVVDRMVELTDVVVLLGFNRILRGRILTEPTYGALSLHWSDIRRYRGRPGCYWQFLNGEETIGLTLQQLTDELDGGNIVVCRHADISDAVTWWDVRLRATELYGSMLAEGIPKLARPGYEPEVLAEEELGVMTYEADGYTLANALRMTARNAYGRLFG